MIDQEKIREFTESFNKLGTAFAHAFNEWYEKAWPPMMETMTKIDAAVWQAYRNAGAIYGDTEEGRARWLQEYGEIRRLRTKADDLEWRQESLRLFKQQLQERQEQRGAHD